MTDLSPPPQWTGMAADPVDEQFGHVVDGVTLAEVDDYDTVIVGEPTDRGVIGRQGAREGPAAIRDALADTKTHHIDAGPVSNVADVGDVTFPDGSVADAQNAALENARDVHARDAFPVFLGGDNSMTYPNASPLLENGSLGCLNLDAHLDVRTVHETPSSGTPYRQLLDDGLDAYAVLGARHFETSTQYVEDVAAIGDVFTADAVGADPEGVAAAALDALGDVDAVHVSVDLDVLDAAFAPGVSAPTPGGLSTRDLFSVLYAVASDPRIAGFEVVECAPPLDRDGMTATAGARAIAHFLAGRNR